MHISKSQLFQYFKGECPDELSIRINEWLGESEENRRMFREASDEYEWLVLNADLDSLKGIEPVEVTRRKANVHTAVKIIANVAAIAVFFVLATLAVQYRVEKELGSHPVAVSVPDGQRLDFTLADGTTVQLNSGATLSYPVLFSDKSRTVRLSGEAYFNVTHNEDCPFIVNTFAYNIEVLGTKFSVDADEESGSFSAVLAEGSIRLADASDPSKSIVMQPDQKASIADGRIVLENRPAELEAQWTKGIIDISGLQFSQLMRKLEKAFGVKIVIQRETMPEIRFTGGRLRVSDGIEYALEVLQNGSDFTWEKDFRTGTIYIR